MQIDLTEEQCWELQSVLEYSLGELGDEIADSGYLEYGNNLRQRRDILESILYLIDNPSRSRV